MDKLKSKIEGQKKNYIAIASRYFFYGFGFLDSLLLPKLLETSLYENYEYYKNAIFMFPNVLLGAYSGYIFIKFSKGYDLYDTLFSVGVLISFIAALLIALFTRNPLIILPLLLINLFVIIEQGLKVKKKYVQAFLFKPLLSIMILSFGLVNLYWFNINISPEQLVLSIFVLAFLLWIPFIRDCIPSTKAIKSLSKRSFLKFFYIIKEFASGALGSLVFLIVIFLERYFIKRYYPEFLAEYSFVFNISQIMVICLTVFNYITSIEYGEGINSLSKSKVTNSLKKSFLVFLAFYMFYMLGVFGLSSFYGNFPNMVWMIAILALSKGFLFFIGIFKPIAVYKGFNLKILIAISAVFIGNVALSLTIGYLRLPIIYLLLTNAFLLTLYAFYLLHILFNKIEYSKA